MYSAKLFNDTFEVGRRVRRPANPHLRMEHLLKTGPDFFVCKKLSPVELAQTSSDLLPEPSVVIEIAFDQLLDVLIRAALVLRHYTDKPCL